MNKWFCRKNRKTVTAYFMHKLCIKIDFMHNEKGCVLVILQYLLEWFLADICIEKRCASHYDYRERRGRNREKVFDIFVVRCYGAFLVRLRRGET